jgi:hypothetical protein
MPKNTAKLPSLPRGELERAGTPFEAGQGAMFGFTPPAAPETTPTPCPHCANAEAIPLYATARTEYFRCARCQQIWTLTHGDDAPASRGDVAAA